MSKLMFYLRPFGYASVAALFVHFWTLEKFLMLLGVLVPY